VPVAFTSVSSRNVPALDRDARIRGEVAAIIIGSTK